MHKQVHLAALVEQVEGDLGSIRRMLRKPLEAEVARGEMTAPQTSVMQIVVRHNGISLTDLSRAVILAHSTVSGIVDRLEKRGMLERRTCAADKRITLIYATDIVKDFVRDKIPELTRRPLAAALERAGHAERTAIAHAIRRLRELLHQN